MKNFGPMLERLTHRLAETPADFMAEPRIGKKGDVFVDAVVSDLVLDLGGSLPSENQVKPFAVNNRKRRNYLRLVLIASWLFHDEWFREKKAFAEAVESCLASGLDDLAALVAADLFVTDPDRREELARLCLNALDLLPEGETVAQSEDRLKTLNSVERSKVVAAAKAKEEQARKVREAAARKRAREAAAKVNHE